MKYCSPCKTYKDPSEFTKAKSTKDGLNHYCKDCTRASNHKSYSTNKVTTLARTSAYSKTERGKAIASKAAAKWLKENPKKYLAHLTVRIAVKRGVLVAQPCHCGNKKVQAHHHDYDRQLDVEWLCAQHHKDAHNQRI